MESNMGITKLILATLMVFNFSTLHAEGDKTVYITVDSDASGLTEKKFGQRVEEVESGAGISVLKIEESALPWLSMFMHKDFKRCGGFMLHEDLDEALEQVNNVGEQKFMKSLGLINYTINQESTVTPLMAQLKADNIFQTITKLSSFQNRYYKGEFGKASAQWIKDTWAGLAKSRSDVTVDFFKHNSWDQPSVIMTIQGSSKDIIIIGGHQDSINGYFGGQTSRAPGADDNASGIATITEIIRVFMESGYKPEKTIKFMAYAAEEVGLLGSKEISQSFKRTNENVVGVLQLDMTNFKGSQTLDIVMMTDYTNDEQNKFIGSIIDKYVPGVKWGYDKCGYGCSDHASWYSQGFPASMPFESRMGDMNHKIHTADDTLKISGNSADHAIKFAKMGLAYLIELDR